ncbi:MAG: alpha/beta fold hydrolase [Pyrinomonadaceae bacterium]
MVDPKQQKKITTKKRLKIILGVYLFLLLVSGIFRFFSADDPFPSDKKQVTVAEVDGDKYAVRQIRIAYREFLPQMEPGATPIFLLHGSPGEGGTMQGLAEKLSVERRVICPDLPGFGNSTKYISDYSFRAHARYVLELAERLGIERFDVLGFSMGSGVALNMYEIAPEKVRSIEIVSGIGVQEYELLGDYNLNHLLHGAQLAGFYILREATPHFGAIGEMPITYARNFYDSDQRNLRGILQKINIPVLIVHGRQDPLVPVDTAREHARLVPQSEYFELPDEDHFTTFMHPERLSPMIEAFLATVENGTAKRRASAEFARLKEAEKPFVLKISEAQGVTAFVYFLIISLSTLVSEDLAAIASGVLAANGRISLTLAITASFFGIYVGDLLLFMVGKWFGKNALRGIPIRWFVSETSAKIAGEWFEKRGTHAVLLSRFTPSLRLPTYLSAGIFGMSFLKFVVVSGIAVAIWTPILVVLAYWLGAETLTRVFSESQSTIWKIILTLFAFYFLIKLMVKLSTWKGRRLFVGKLKRIINWEFWPLQIFYFPVVVYCLLLAIKHRSLTVFTAANPGIASGGFIGESKNEIYKMIRTSQVALPFMVRHILLGNHTSREQKIELAQKFIVQNDVNFPVILKPDAGERGKGVTLIRSEPELIKFLQRSETDLILQEYCSGDEASIFFSRFPGREKGSIFSITEKLFPTVTGDGKSNLEELILNDDRAVCLAEKYFEQNADRLGFIPAKDDEVKIIDIGTHSRGAIFLDGEWMKTEALELKIDEICRGIDGFFFGRFDIRTPSFDELMQGRNFKLIELNGVTSESTNIYDPKYSLIDAYRILFRQWRIAFEIGAENRKLGEKTTGIYSLFKLLSGMPSKEKDVYAKTDDGALTADH